MEVYSEGFDEALAGGGIGDGSKEGGHEVAEELHAELEALLVVYVGEGFTQFVDDFDAKCGGLIIRTLFG